MYNKGFENRGRGNGRGYDNPEPVVFEFSSLGFVDSKGNLREELMTVEAEKQPKVQRELALHNLELSLMR